MSEDEHIKAMYERNVAEFERGQQELDEAWRRYQRDHYRGWVQTPTIIVVLTTVAICGTLYLMGGWK